MADLHSLMEIGKVYGKEKENKTMREYANEIAKEIEKRFENAEVRVVDVPKANGIMYTGISVRFAGTNIAPTVYVNSFYEQHVPVDVAVRELGNVLTQEQEKIGQMNTNMDWFTDFENVKDKLTARLYNKTTKAEVKRSAKAYGFDDLVIVPYVELEMADRTQGAIKITQKHIDLWGVTARKVIDIALKNTEKTAKITDLLETIAEMQGIKVEDIPFEVAGPRMLIITNDKTINGASAILGKIDYFKEKFGEFYIIPSSIHEVLVVPVIPGMPKEALEEIIGQVNREVVVPEEFLSNQAYHFVA